MASSQQGHLGELCHPWALKCNRDPEQGVPWAALHSPPEQLGWQRVCRTARGH